MIKTKFLVVATALTLGMACVQDPEMETVKHSETSIEAKFVNTSEDASNGELLMASFSCMLTMLLPRSG